MADRVTTHPAFHYFWIVLTLFAVAMAIWFLLDKVGALTQAAAITTPQGATSEVGSFDIAAPQSLPYDGSFALKKTFSSGAMVNLVAEDGTQSPVQVAVRSRVGKDVTYRIQSVPKLGALVNTSFIPDATSGSMNQRVGLMELADGKMAIGVSGTLWVSGTATVTRMAYFLSNDNGGFRKAVDFMGATLALGHDWCVNTNDNKPMCVAIDAETGPTCSFRKADNIEGTSFGGTGGASLTTQSMETSTNYVGIEGDIRLMMVNKKPMIFWLVSQTASKVMCMAASDSYGSSWGSAVTALTMDTDTVVSTVSVAIVNGRPAVAAVEDHTGEIHFARASNDAATTWNSTIVLTASAATDANNVAFELVPGVKNSAGVLVPAIVYIGAGTNDVFVCMADDVDGVTWPATESQFPNSTILDEVGVYEASATGSLGAITDPDGNLIVVTIDEDRNHFLMWKCSGGTPPSEPHILDIAAPIYGTSAKGGAFRLKVIHGKPTMAWVETDSVRRLRWCQFDDYEMNQKIHIEYAVQA